MSDSSLRCKLIDFGISRFIYTKQGKRLTGNVGTAAVRYNIIYYNLSFLKYIAPEVFKPPFDYSEKADVYSFAFICL